ncbi:hypothetical protein BH23GEM5_BH23GEM5_08140 [soil metagenome]
MAFGRQVSADGHEMHFAVNCLSHYLLTRTLLPLLLQAPSARIINVASGAQQPIDFDDEMLERNYSDRRGYAQSKLAQILFTLELARELRGTGVTVNALHPCIDDEYDDGAFPRGSRAEQGGRVRRRSAASGHLVRCGDRPVLHW